MPAARPNRLFVPRVMWFAFVASTFVYLFLVFTVPDPSLEPNGSMLLPMALIAVACAVVSFWLPASLHRKGARAAKLEVKEVPDPDASVILRQEAPPIRVFADPEQAMRKAMSLFFTPFILSMALTEAVVIYGLVLGFVGFDPITVIPFFVVGWLLFLLRFPRLSQAVEPLERGQNARFES